ncbi:MAG TPA: glycosyltransferase [Solirubrobacteraceae bacterium]|jgi:rhamnosyltransferase|nr:glycosyltransferase [Solirubrobacteraceae bacterium]
MSEVTVAIPVRDGGELLAGTLAALARQTVAHELLVCDSGSSDGSAELARAHGARVIEIAPASFSHGGTRNLLMREAKGAHVALLTQDAEPVDERWLERLLGAFELAEDVGIAFGPYRPRPDASSAVRVELERFFGSLSPSGEPLLERLAPEQRGLPASAFLGGLGFFTDANACIARVVWERVPYRAVPYAEDRVLALDVLRAGYAKAFVPDAPVLHSHEYTALQELGRCFDEWRGLLEVYGWREPIAPRRVLGKLRGELSADRAAASADGLSGAARRARLLAAGRHHALRLTGALLGSRADRMPAPLRAGLSLERRSSFAPLDPKHP